MHLIYILYKSDRHLICRGSQEPTLGQGQLMIISNIKALRAVHVMFIIPAKIQASGSEQPIIPPSVAPLATVVPPSVAPLTSSLMPLSPPLPRPPSTLNCLLSPVNQTPLYCTCNHSRSGE